MSMSVGASSSSALSYLQQLLQQGQAGAGDAINASDPLSMLMQEISGDGSSLGQTSTAATSGAATGSSVPPFGTDTMSALISLQGQSASSGSARSPEQAFFSKLDADGDGQISQSEFENAASKVGVSTSTADAVFAKIDGDSDGSISQSELTKADHGGGHHHHHVGGGGGAQGSSGSGQSALDALVSGTGADGATTQTATNADGSTTTTISYADGSKIDMTTPAAASSGSDTSGSNTSGGSTTSKSASNLLEQLIKLQSQVLNVATSTMSAFA
jgi:hypothetical protein